MRRTLCRPGGDPRPPAALAAYEPGSTAQASVIFLGGMLHAPISELSSLEFYPPRPGATSTREETCPFRCPSSNGARCRCPPVTRSVTIHPYDRYQRSDCRHGLVGLPAGPAATARIGPSGDEIFRGADHMVPHRGPRPRRRCRSRWPRRRHCAARRPYCRLLCPARPHDRHPDRALRRRPRVINEIWHDSVDVIYGRDTSSPLHCHHPDSGERYSLTLSLSPVTQTQEILLVTAVPRAFRVCLTPNIGIGKALLAEAGRAQRNAGHRYRNRAKKAHRTADMVSGRTTPKFPCFSSRGWWPSRCDSFRLLRRSDQPDSVADSFEG